eukprot:3499991-Amphidinium_carterae.3
MVLSSKACKIFHWADNLSAQLHGSPLQARLPDLPVAPPTFMPGVPIQTHWQYAPRSSKTLNQHWIACLL